MEYDAMQHDESHIDAPWNDRLEIEGDALESELLANAPEGETGFPEDFPEAPEDGFMSDVEADADALASAGMGTDEDYGSFGGEDF